MLMHKNGYEVIAAIDVGSNAIRMSIAQVDARGDVKTLEDLYKPTGIGRDTFATGRIQAASLHDLCDTLTGFSRVMKQYKVRHYTAVSTSGIREAENKEYVLEQIRVTSGLEVRGINNTEARFFMYKAIRELINKAKTDSHSGTLIVDIGSGGVEMSAYSRGNLKFTEYIKVGSLRLREILAGLEDKTLDFPQVMEEFIDSRIAFFTPLLSQASIKSFIGLGGDLRTIIELSKAFDSSAGQNFVKSDTLKRLYLKICGMTTSQIAKEFKLTQNDAEVLMSSVILFHNFLNMTDAEGIYAPMSSLRHGLLVDMVDELLDTPGRHEAIGDIISSVWYIGEKYFIDKEHCRYIEQHSTSIFDQMSKIHRLGQRERLYLQVASILHDAGKYINPNSHDVHSYNIIRFQDILGLSERELDIIANIARYHSHEIPSQAHENYRMLENGDGIIVSKLAAILRVAEALDISHKRKVKKIEIQVCERTINFDIWASEDMLLEEWNFAGNAAFFEEVMGYRPVLNQRRVQL